MIRVSANGEQGKITTDIQKPVEPGATYQITVSAKGSNGAENDSISISARTYDADNNAMGESSKKFLVTGDYQDYTYTYVPGESEKYFGLKVNSGDVAGDYFVDDIRVSKIEDNATTIVDSQKEEIKIFPNPTTGKLQISNLPEQSIVTVYSQTGQKLISKTGIEQVNFIDLSLYNNGIYFVEVKSYIGIRTSKVVKH